jgi:hypothetical protein
MPVTGQNTRNTEVITGVFSLFAGLSIIATILTRFEFVSFFSSFSEDLEYLSDNIFLLRINSITWLITALILTISASTFIVLLNPYHRLFSWTTGFFLILAAAMISVSGIKGFSIIDILDNFRDLNLTDNDALKVAVFTLAREKEIYIVASYTLLGLAFLSLAAFAFRTRRLSIFTGLVSLITGIILPVFTVLIPESLLSDIGLVAGFLTFLIIGMRLLFSGLEKKQRKTIHSQKSGETINDHKNHPVRAGT